MHANNSYALNMDNEIALGQECGYRIDGDQIHINVSNIANNRNWGNLSGTLTLELWALRHQYNGGYFEGVAVAGAPIGELQGQFEFNQYQLSTHFQEPPVGQWYLTLMLREWTASGFETRDYVNFSVPYITSWQPTVVPGKKVINVDFNEGDKAGAATEKQQAEPKKVNVEKTETPVKAAPAVTAKVEKADKALDSKVEKKAEKKAEQLNINEADAKQFAAIKGVSNKLASAMQAAQPFKSVDDLLKVKGMGAKLLDKIRKQLTL